MPTNLARGAAAFVCVALAAVGIAGCPVTSDSNNNNFITAEPKAFSIHTIDHFASQAGSAIDSQIIVVHATYTNNDVNEQVVQASKFALIDQNTQATYYALSGGDINVPAMANTSLESGKSIDISVGFRVPVVMTSARLVYRL